MLDDTIKGDKMKRNLKMMATSKVSLDFIVIIVFYVVREPIALENQMYVFLLRLCKCRKKMVYGGIYNHRLENKQLLVSLAQYAKGRCNI
jgi:hypothetical protein